MNTESWKPRVFLTHTFRLIINKLMTKSGALDFEFLPIVETDIIRYWSACLEFLYQLRCCLVMPHIIHQTRISCIWNLVLGNNTYLPCERSVDVMIRSSQKYQVYRGASWRWPDYPIASTISTSHSYNILMVYCLLCCKCHCVDFFWQVRP